MTSPVPVAGTLAFIGAFATAFLTTFFIIPWLIPKLKARGIVGKDLHKSGHPEIAEMGGIAVVIGFFAGASVILALDGVTDREILNVSLSVVLGAAFVGMIDDIFDLRQSQKAFFPFLLALPLGIAIQQSVFIPFVGSINLGILMIFVAPFAVTCAANAGNMLEGFNGLGTGLGIIMASTLIILCIVHDRYDGLFLLIPLLGGLVAFLWYNGYPSRIFPGDTLMLFTGATLATAAMLSQLYIQASVIFIPMIAEFFLKLRGRFRAENYGQLQPDGKLAYSGRNESLTHILMKHMHLTERGLTHLVWAIQLSVCLLVISVDVIV